MSRRSRMAGPLAGFAPGFAAELLERGYRPRPAAEQLRLMGYVSGWLAARDLGTGDLTEVVVGEVMAARRASGRVHLISPRALVPLLEYLRGLGVVPVPQTASETTAAEVIVERYAAYLRERRSVVPSTVRNYVGVARAFLGWREATAGGLLLERLDATAVSAFVLVEAQRSSGGSAKCLVTRLRVFLRFLHVDGEIARELAGAVPSVAGWRLVGLVKALDARSLGRLLAGCDRRTRVGRRDHAVITLLSRLGLRAGEVAPLQLADIDWRCGELLVRGKGSRHERLPLPTDVGETLAGWLERGRPRRDSRLVFTGVRAPYADLTGTAVSHRPPRLPAGRGAGRRRAPAAAQRRDRDAPRGSELDRG